MALQKVGLHQHLTGTLLGSLLMVFGAVPARPMNQGGQDPQAQQLRLARSFDFGAFCLSDIPPGSIKSVGRPDFAPDGTWRQVTIEVNEADARKPRIFFFGGIRRESGLFSRCGKDLPQDVRRIVEGNVVKGTLKFRILDPDAGFTQAFEIDGKELDVVIGQVGTDFLPLYGGKVVPAGIQLRVSNVGRFVANPRTPQNTDDNILQGQLRIGSARLRLQEAKLRLPGSASEIRASFVSGRDGVALDVDIPSGRLALYDGSFRATAVDLPQGLLALGGAEFDLANGRAATLDIVGQAQKGEPLMRLGTVSLTARTILHTAPPVARLTPAEPVTIAEVAGVLAPDQGAALLVDPTARDLRVPRATVAFGGTLDRPALAGLGTVVLSSLDAASMSGEARLATPDLPAAQEAVSELVAREITLRFEGAKSAPKLAGQLDLIAARLRTFGLAGLERVLVGFDGQGGGGELGLRFSVDTSTPAGRWSFADPTGAILLLEGAIRQVKAAGTLWFGTSAQPPRLQVDPNAFRLAAGGTVVRRALAFGARADQTSLSADVDLGSAAGFTVTKTGAEGRVELATSLLAVTGPNLSFDDSSAGQFRILGSLRFETGATLGIQLANLDVTLTKGHAIVDHLGAEALTDQPIRFVDLEVTSPKLTLERLEIDVQGETGTVKGRGLVFEARGIRHTADPRWEVDAPNPRIPELQAILGRVNDALVLKEGIVRGFDLRADRGSYRSRDGFVIAGEGIAITAARLSESAIESGRIAIARGSLSLNVADGGIRTTGSTAFDTFEITADGPKDDIAGTGRVHLTDLQIDHQFPILQEKCDQNLQLKASLSVGAVDIGLRLEHSEIHGNARIASPRVRLRHTSNNECEWNDHWDVNVTKVVTEPVCQIPLIGPAICDTIRRLIPVQVRVPLRFRAVITQIDVKGSASHIDLDLHGARGMGFCVHDAKLDSLGRIQLFSVAPTFQASGDVGNAIKDVFDAILQVGLGIVESAFGTAIINYGSILTQIAPAGSCG
jgi:hypothetical protein